MAGVRGRNESPLSDTSHFLSFLVAFSVYKHNNSEEELKMSLQMRMFCAFLPKQKLLSFCVVWKTRNCSDVRRLDFSFALLTNFKIVP